jgi:nucleoside-diphosphate-sugar epimerase
MIIAITGATGFIGKRLALSCLENGDEVRILTRKKTSNLSFPADVKIYNGDLVSDEKDLALFLKNADILYHCAAEIKDESKMFEVNVKGTEKLIQIAKGRVKHWIQLSSTGIYGPLMSGDVSENQKINPTNEYERSKAESDKLVIDAAFAGFFSFSILRPSNVFGGDMRNQSLFQLIKAVDKGIFFFIGRKGANANYIPVENVVHALILIGKEQKAKGNIYNISDAVTLETFVGYITEFLHKPVPKVRFSLLLMKTLGFFGNFIPKFPLTLSRVNALTNRTTYKNDLIVEHLGYAPVVSIKDCIEEMVMVYKSKSDSSHI